MHPAAELLQRAGQQLRRHTVTFVEAGGARESGLARLIVLHAVGSMGDALVTVALAGTLFFGVPTGQARGRIALYLLITMAPFAVVAPLIGPLLDRLRRGRRLAIGVTLLGRAVLALTLARAVGSADALVLYPTALGVLVLSKAYGVARSSVVPRLAPPGATLVQVNGRLTLASVVPATLVAPVGAALGALFGSGVTLRFAALVYLAGLVTAFRLPRHADSPDEGEARLQPFFTHSGVLGPSVPGLLRSASAIRLLSGFLLLFTAFLVRRHHLTGLPGNLTLGLLAAALAAGGLLGTAAGARMRRAAPELLVTWMLGLATVGCVLAAELYGIGAALLLVFLTAGAQSLSKLSLDAVIQRDIAEEVRTSAFGRSETVLQLAWVVGGAVGILLPSDGTLGFTLAALVLGVALVGALRYNRRHPLLPAQPAPAPPSTATTR